MHELELNKIYCMDCLEGLKLIPDNSIDLVVTSLPYNLGVFIKHKKDIYTEYNDKNLVWKDLIKNSLDECLRVAKNEVFYNIQYVSNNKVDLFEIIGEYKTKIKDILIWEKTLPAPAINAHVLTHSYEFIFVFSMSILFFAKLHLLQATLASSQSLLCSSVNESSSFFMQSQYFVFSLCTNL